MSGRSRTSLEGQFHDSEQYETYEEYLKMLKTNNHIISQALRKAEDIIDEYQRENQQLKAKNKQLQVRLGDLQDQIQYLKQLLLKDQSKRMQAKMVDLALRNDNAEKRMSSLLEQLQKSEAKVAKLTRLKHEKTQKSMQNYFQFPTPKSKYGHLSANEDLNREIRSLKWKLEQREQQIMYMIKKNKMLEEKQDKSRKEKGNFRKLVDEDRFFTCETEPTHLHNY